MSQPQHTNRLAGSTSPYLLQHAHNPVDWYPWGEEALTKARAEDKPIFLSIGYSACHWCHVMERESFENPAIAEVLNRDYVSIKVDREERPDLDEIYMTATQLMTHSGGWPMSVFLTPELKPFFAGTYFPPEDRWGRPGFMTLLTELTRMWTTQRARCEEQAQKVTEAVAEMQGGGEGGQGALSHNLIRHAVEQFASSFDPKHGGFGAAPKFPPSMRIELLLRQHRHVPQPELLHMATLTLDRMARGGMYDQVGGGFHRYSVDERWLVPHFEKMLYDNALLARVYALAHEQTGNAYFGRVGREILDYVVREMTDPEGGFYSATDADSEGEEGRFFVWSPEQVVAVLGQEAGTLFNRIYDIAPGGNFEGHSIPNLLNRSLEDWAAELGGSGEELDLRLVPLRRRLWEQRETRVHPLRDDKVLTGWNGLMIRAFAEGYRVFQDQRYRDAAEKAAEFILTRMRNGDRLLRAYRGGKAHLNGYLEDYAAMAAALLDLHRVTAEPRWLEEGLALLHAMNERFWDEDGGSFYFTSHDHEELITRTKSLPDNATPSGNSLALQALIAAAKLTGEDRFREQAAEMLSAYAPQIAQMAAAFPNALVAADEYLEEWPEGVRVAGADAVAIEGMLSRTAVAAGETFWLGLRLKVAPGYHINSARPRQDYLIPTAVEVDPQSRFEVVGLSYPEPEDYQAPFAEGVLSVYSGDALVGVELRAPADAELGQHSVHLVLRLQPCDDQQCYPPMEARMRFLVNVAEQPGTEQFAEAFSEITARSGG